MSDAAQLTEGAQAGPQGGGAPEAGWGTASGAVAPGIGKKPEQIIRSALHKLVAGTNVKPV